MNAGHDGVVVGEVVGALDGAFVGGVGALVGGVGALVVGALVGGVGALVGWYVFDPVHVTGGAQAPVLRHVGHVAPSVHTELGEREQEKL